MEQRLDIGSEEVEAVASFHICCPVRLIRKVRDHSVIGYTTCCPQIKTVILDSLTLTDRILPACVILLF